AVGKRQGIQGHLPYVMSPTPAPFDGVRVDVDTDGAGAEVEEITDATADIQHLAPQVANQARIEEMPAIDDSQPAAPAQIVEIGPGIGDLRRIVRRHQTPRARTARSAASRPAGWLAVACAASMIACAR